MKNGFGPIYKIGETVGILVLLNLFWSITVLAGLGLTIGAATSATYVIVRKRFKGEDEIMLHNCFSEYWKALKANFKQSTVIWIISLVLGTMLVANIKFSLISYEPLKMGLQAIQIIILIQLVFINIYCYSLISTFESKTNRIVYSSLLISNAHLLTTLTCVAVGIGLLATLRSFNYLTSFILVSGYIAITAFIFKPIFKKYSIKL